MTPIEGAAIAQEFRTDLERWDKFLGSRWLTQDRELDEDYGELERLGGSSRKLLVVLNMFGDNPALNDNAVDEMRGWSNAFIKREVNNLREGYCDRLAPALDAIESGLRRIVDGGTTEDSQHTDDSSSADEWRQKILADEKEERLSIEQAAGCISMSDRTVYRMMDDGMPYMQPRDKPKSHRRIRKSDVLAWRKGIHPDQKKSSRTQSDMACHGETSRSGLLDRAFARGFSRSWKMQPALR